MNPNKESKAVSGSLNQIFVLFISLSEQGSDSVNTIKKWFHPFAFDSRLFRARTKEAVLTWLVWDAAVRGTAANPVDRRCRNIPI